MKPLADWEYEGKEIIPGLVWFNILDNRYQIEVQRSGSNSAQLVIFDHDDNNKVVAIRPVLLSYNAMFGPDDADVRYWMELVSKIVDEDK